MLADVLARARLQSGNSDVLFVAQVPVTEGEIEMDDSRDGRATKLA